MLKTAPAIFAVGNDYQIMVEVEGESLFSVRIGEKTYYDESNGIMNSLSPMHRVTVPMKELDAARRYTVCVRPLVNRKPYFPITEEMWEKDFDFHPIPETNVRAYHIADAHNKIEEPIRAVNTFGAIDLLILNGDVITHSGDPSKFRNIYEICARLTEGTRPVIFSRGNHDMRGKFAEKFAEFTPNQNGHTYYTFHLGHIWGLLLDCGEDKSDDHAEYGFTVACHAFRERQTDFLHSLIENADREYAAHGVKTKLVIAHTPFTQKIWAPFDIEEPIYREWCALLREHVKPDLMICGHMHKEEIRPIGHEADTYGQPCPVVIGARPGENYFLGCGFIFGDDAVDVVFTDSDGNTTATETLTY